MYRKSRGHTSGKRAQISTQQRIATGANTQGAGAGVGEADRVGDRITHLGGVRTSLGDIDRRIDQVHAVAVIVTGWLSKPSTSQVMVAVLSNGLGSPT